MAWCTCKDWLTKRHWCTVSAVNDGYVLRKSVLRSPVGGRLLDECLHASLAAKDVTLHPWYAYSALNKLGGSTAAAKALEGLTKSHITWATRFLVSDIKETICRCVSAPTSSVAIALVCFSPAFTSSFHFSPTRDHQRMGTCCNDTRGLQDE